VKFTVMVLLFLGAGAAGCSSQPARNRVETPVATVTLVHASTANVPARFESGGVVRAKLTAPIAARVLAPIGEVRVRPGDRVRRGQTLVLLDGRDLQAQAERASAGLSASQQAVRAAAAEQQGAAAALTLATLSFDRVNGLYAKRSATKQELDEATATLEAARARAAGTDAHIAESKAALTAAQSAADVATITASYATIAAPFDGVVTERFVDPGAMTAPAAPILTIEDVSDFRLEVRLDEARAEGVALGQLADVRLDSVEDLPIRARVVEVSRIDPGSHAFLVKLDLPRSAGIRSGVFGRATFSGAPRATLSVPRSALVRRGQLSFAFVVDHDGIARLRPVSVGETFDDRVEVLAGVSDGEALVGNPPPTLTDGTKVTAGGRP
jgi:multidrug efflux pump subunit AcrA (membrane-fusion protein)